MLLRIAAISLLLLAYALVGTADYHEFNYCEKASWKIGCEEK